MRAKPLKLIDPLSLCLIVMMSFYIALYCQIQEGADDYAAEQELN